MNKLEQLQKIELKMLKQIDKICNQNNIRYYLGEGTLLGVIRHQGFIPWDDDIDILMPRKDYEKFLKIAPKLISQDLEIQHSSLIKNYWVPFIKVRYLKKTFYKQKNIEHLTNHNGPFIDIFPIDSVPKKSSLNQTIQSIIVKLNRGMLAYKLKTATPKTCKGCIMKLLSNFISVKKLHNNLNKTFTKYNNKNNKYFINLGSYHNHKDQTIPKNWYGAPRMVKFENMIVPIPKEAEKILTKVYGDYMKLPKEEDRLTKHYFD